jgi:hypothetical protein
MLINKQPMETCMSDSFTKNTLSLADTQNAPAETTYKVWIDIEEYDELTDCSKDCDAPGGALATFNTYEEAWDFAQQIDLAYSTHRKPCGSPKDHHAITKNAGIEATVPLPLYVADAIDAVLSYLWKSERADYECCPWQDRDRHIFCHLEVISRWLKLHTNQTTR